MARIYTRASVVIPVMRFMKRIELGVGIRRRLERLHNVKDENFTRCSSLVKAHSGSPMSLVEAASYTVTCL
jgi:hypothetical protein